MVLYISYSACSLACIFLDIIHTPYCKSITTNILSSIFWLIPASFMKQILEWFGFYHPLVSRLTRSWSLCSFCLLSAPNWSMWSLNWLVRLLKATWLQLFQIHYSGLTIQELCCSWSTSCCSKMHLRLQFSSGYW